MLASGVLRACREAGAAAPGAAFAPAGPEGVIRAVDDEGVGIADLEYLVVTPDQRRFTGLTDASGRARVEGIVAGQCSVSFRTLDRTAWRRA